MTMQDEMTRFSVCLWEFRSHITKAIELNYMVVFSHVLDQVEVTKLAIEYCNALVLEAMLGEVEYDRSGFPIIEEVPGLVPKVFYKNKVR